MLEVLVQGNVTAYSVGNILILDEFFIENDSGTFGFIHQFFSKIQGEFVPISNFLFVCKQF